MIIKNGEGIAPSTLKLFAPSIKVFLFCCGSYDISIVLIDELEMYYGGRATSSVHS